jgi:hypothetical protein
MGKEPTTLEIKRDEFFKGLGRDPAEALRHWKRLKSNEQLLVFTYIAMSYGMDFAKHFKAHADKRERPDLYYTVTNLPYVDHQYLTKRGYKFRGVIGNTDMEVWVHPSGHEYWRIPPAKAAPPQPPPPTPSQTPVPPEIDELRGYIKAFTERKNDLLDEAKRIEDRRPTLTGQQYKDLRKKWWQDYNDADEELDDLITEILSDLRTSLTPAERTVFDADVVKLKNLWSSWPGAAMSPPPWGSQRGEQGR